jgi:FMN phosphatase YigB (HAD superfamily)
LRTYADFVPESRLVARVLARLGGWPWSSAEIDTEPDFERFGELLPLGNRAEDFGVALLAMDLGLPVTDQEAYDGLYDSMEADWLRRFHLKFYEVRSALRAESPDAWLALHADYPELTAALPRIAERATLAVATAKDGLSLALLLDEFGLSELFPKKLRLDKETGVQKTEHLTRLAEQLEVPFAAITFVDDKVNHLARVAPLGVRPVLACWGHNTEREHAAALSHGFEVARLDDVELVLSPRGGS